MNLDIQTVMQALQYALDRHGPGNKVVAEDNVSPDQGDTYRLIATTYRDPNQGYVFRVDAQSNLFLDYRKGFAVYEISRPEPVSDDSFSVTVRVGKIGEAEKQRIRVAANGVEDAMPVSNSLQGIYDILRKLDSTLPEYHTLSEAKLKIFISQIVTLRMTLKM